MKSSRPQPSAGGGEDLKVDRRVQERARNTRLRVFRHQAMNPGVIMKAVLRQDVPMVIEGDGVEVRLQEIGGGMSTSFIRLPQGTDMGPR